GDAGIRLERFIEGVDDLGPPTGRLGHVFTQRTAVNRQRGQVQQTLLTQLAEYDGQAACFEEVFHQVATGWHQVEQAVHAAAQPVPVIQVEVDAHTACQGDEVYDGIGRTADGGIGPDGILECFACQDLRQAHVVMLQLNDAASGFAR